MSAVVGIGFLIKYTLISGKERNVIYGKNVELSLFGMDRHEWGYIHLVIAFVFYWIISDSSLFTLENNYFCI
tara:strand:+ start:2890 stop:3105 length:216 start_codon:yes stop_codon:yes gene_type:complete